MHVHAAQKLKQHSLCEIKHFIEKSSPLTAQWEKKKGEIEKYT